jgi:hypothetical protein
MLYKPEFGLRIIESKIILDKKFDGLKEVTVYAVVFIPLFLKSLFFSHVSRNVQVK